MRPLWVLALLALVLAGCGAPGEEASVASRRAPLTVGGCTCPTSGSCSTLSYSDIPSDSTYYVTTFGGGSDTQPMACGGTADGTWAYVADSARFGCGARLIISAGGKQCVAEVADCGPNRCVEQAASYSSCASHFPIIDASPYITSYLLGASGVGWSDKKIVTATLAPAGATLGCPGVVPPSADAAPPPEPDAGPPPKLDAKPPAPPPDAKQPRAPDLKPPPARDAKPPRWDQAAPALPGADDEDLPPSLASGAKLKGGCQVAPSSPPPAAPALIVLALLLARSRGLRGAAQRLPRRSRSCLRRSSASTSASAAA